MTKIEAAWLAGMVEGEGYLRVGKPLHHSPPTTIVISSTDKDVCEKLQRVAGCGALLGPYESKRNGKPVKNWSPYWLWQVGNKLDILKIGRAIRPHMCARRKAALDKLIATAKRVDEYKALRQHQTHCKRGHEFTDDNTIVSKSTGHRRCRRCANKKHREWRAKQPKKPKVPRVLAMHCKYGHPFSGANLIIESNGQRACRECKRAACRRYYQRKQKLQCAAGGVE